MNKTELEIIEIVEPYMNKELVQGCMVGVGNYTTSKKKEDVRNSLLKLEYMTYDGDNRQYFFSNLLDSSKLGTLEEPKYVMRCNFDKYIIGTLDITAILKYIEANYKEPIDEKIVISDKYFHVIGLCSEFPNKPYTTYTQEEKESLLEILKSLK